MLFSFYQKCLLKSCKFTKSIHPKLNQLCQLNKPVLAYFHQAIAESGSALSGWAFDSSPESHAHEIASTHLGCPTDSTTALVGCSHISSNSTCVCSKYHQVHIQFPNLIHSTR